MNVPSYAFLAFATVVALAINLSNAPRWRQLVFLAANLAFVSTFTRDVMQLEPFAALLALGYIAMKLLERSKRAALFVTLLIAVVLAFCWLKRYTFIPPRLFLEFTYYTVGMSYVFFRMMHLIIDAFQDALPERLGIVSYINYTLNFTSLVSGPIQFYRDYRRSACDAPLRLTADACLHALRRIISGFFKVSVMSPLLFYWYELSVGGLSGAQRLDERIAYAVAVLSIFPLYIYFNFSGYTDFVIGVARFLGLTLPENFNRPFRAAGFIDFWSRWHITLAIWVKTYVYSPLVMGLMRRFPSRRLEPLVGVCAYFAAFFIVGVWHGQTTPFVVLGILLGLGVGVNKLYQVALVGRLGRPRHETLCANRLYLALSRGMTAAYFAFASIWFWSTWSQLASFAATLGPAGVALTLVFLVATSTVALWAVNSLDDFVRDCGAVGMPIEVRRILNTAWYTTVVVVTISITVVLNAPAPHIVYRAF